MNTAKSKILVLVEGAKMDYDLMEHLLGIYGISDDHQIFSYDTNIYVLYHAMFKDKDPDSFDLIQVLKEHEQNEEKRVLLNQNYSDILLVFDLDPQDPQFSPDRIREMEEYFVESSDMGKLYLNYPMVESFYHMKSIPDPDYNSYAASLQELYKKEYKDRVNEECRNTAFEAFAVDKAECNIVIRQNIEKAFLLTGEECNDEKIMPEGISILDAQLEKLENEKLVAVLSTCVFYIVEYNPTLIEN